jgi:hypothetical protein
MKHVHGRLVAAVTLLATMAISLPQVQTAAAAAATIVSVTSSSPDGTYKVGEKITITVNFSEPVEHQGWMAVLLETGPSDRVARGPSDPRLQISQSIDLTYTVKPGDVSLDLDVYSVDAFLPGEATFTAGGQAVDLKLPKPGSPNSLSALNNLVVDGSEVDEQWPNPIDSVYGLHGIIMNEDWRENVSFLAQESGSWGPYCQSTSEAACSGKDVHFRAVLPTCSSATQLDCIESVTGRSQTGQSSDGQFSEVFPKKGVLDFTGSAALKIPSGGTTSIFRFPDLPHTTVNGESFDTYAVTVSMGGSNRADGSVGSRTIFASITPVMFRDTQCDERFNGQCMDGSIKQDTSGVAIDQDAGFRCILWDSVDGNSDGKIQTQDTPSDRSTCALKRPFPSGVRFTLKARLSSEPGGWLHGRMDAPEISFDTNKDRSLVTISAGPVRVPTFAGVAPYASLPTAIQKYYDDLCQENCHSFRFGPQSKDISALKRHLAIGPDPFSPQAFSALALWRDYLKDTANALPSQWTVRTLDKGEMANASSCIASGSGVKGIVTTNATAYVKGPPSFDSASKTLKYEVAAPHFEKDGKTEFKGVYNLVVREDIADCLYKFSKGFAAPAPPEEFSDSPMDDPYVEEEPYVDEPKYAEDYPEFGDEFVDTTDGSYEMYEDVEFVDVALDDYVAEEEDFTLTEDVSDTGKKVDERPMFEEAVVASIDASIITELQKAAKANTTIELSDGWFKFSATDFTFSKPTVKVQFRATPSKVVACISGSTVRYVKSIRSQCPSGWAPAKTVYCIKGKTVDAAVAASPKCPKNTLVGKTLKCAKGPRAVLVVAVNPKCAKGYSKVNTYYCVKKDVARRVSSVAVKCANGFALANQIVCVKGKLITTVTAMKPSCPKGYKPKK